MEVNLKDYSVIICSIVRNAEKGLDRNIPIINKLCSLFKTFDIIVYENDSIDSTKYLLQKWEMSDRNRIHIISEDISSIDTIPRCSEVTGNPFFSKRRISKMVSLRNKYMEYIDSHKIKADYIIIVDLDVDKLELDGIINSFTLKDSWDVVSAYGYSFGPHLKKRYHDTYALTLLGESALPQNEKFIYDQSLDIAKYFKHNRSLYPVDSAFGGLTIYKFEAIAGLRYNVVNNLDSRVEVRCEHFSLNRQAAERGFTRIVINPQMTLRYQSLSFQLILNKVISLIHQIQKFMRNAKA